MRDVVVIGASAGGLRPLEQIAAALPTEPALAVFVVQHIGPSRSLLPDLLSRQGKLRAFHPRDGDAIQFGAIHVAPPDRHLVIVDSHIRLSAGPHENLTRPAIDPTFRSAALAFGPRVQGVLLSGGLDDGVAGLAAIKRRGGVTIVQEPSEALMPSMPQTAIETVGIEHVLPAARIAAMIGEIAREPVPALPPILNEPDDIALETEIALRPAGSAGMPAPIGRPSTLCCPTCHGTLWELEEDGGLRYRCRTGHAFGPLALEAAQNYAAEEAIVIAVRTLEERADLYRNMARKAREQGRMALALRWETRLRETLSHRDQLRQVLANAQIAVMEHPPL